MGGENKVGGFAGGSGIDVPTRADGGALGRLFYGRLLDSPAASGEEIGQVIAHRSFVVRGGLDLAQGDGKADWIKNIGGQ
jgi:hypothetical protein